MSARGSLDAVRDQDATPFSAALAQLCEDSSAVAAVLVDSQGEAVDYAGRRSAYETRVLGAEWQIILRLLQERPPDPCHDMRQIVVRTTHRSFVVVDLSDGYVIIVEMPRRSFGISRRALEQAQRALAAEAGFDVPVGRSDERWTRVRVEEEGGRSPRPQRVWWREAWQPVEVLGRVRPATRAPFERGFQVRVADELETTFVREAWGRWFADCWPEDAAP